MLLTFTSNDGVDNYQWHIIGSALTSNGCIRAAIECQETKEQDESSQSCFLQV